MFLQNLFESRSAPLYHSLLPQYAIQSLEKNRLLGTSIQRFSPDGRILPDPDFKHGFIYGQIHRHDPERVAKEFPEIYGDIERWNNSMWYLGVSMTRSFKFALDWKHVVFEIDQAKLIQRYKVIPWNWGSSKNKYKMEQEEFVVLDRIEVPYGPTESNPKITNLDRYLTGIYVKKILKDIGGFDLEVLEAHPLFKGYVKG